MLGRLLLLELKPEYEGKDANEIVLAGSVPMVILV